MFELDVYLRDKLIGRTTFNTDEVRIGRGADNELQIDNLALSRYHASIELVDGFYVLKDFGSQNGTFVNGEKVVGRKPLADNDRIGVGKFIVIFRWQGEPEKSERAVMKAAGNEAAFAVAGETLVADVRDTRERSCPHVGYLSPETQAKDAVRPSYHPIGRDVFVLGSGPGCDVDTQSGPARAAAILRGWKGFSLVAFGSGSARRNGEPVELRADLVDGDRIEIGNARYAFHTGKPEAGP
jgi:pSer/pThr/pTyr-binding forkhead associated (FHA) protein